MGGEQDEPPRSKPAESLVGVEDDAPEADEATTAQVTRRVDALDGLRGLLALVVVFGHVLSLLYPAIDGRGPRRFGVDHLVDRSPLALFISGDFAVRVFFVHSGFVLALKYFRSGDRRWPTAMMLRRPLRLGLPVAAAVVLAWVLGLLVPMQPGRLAAVTGGTASEQFPVDPPTSDVVLDAVGGTALLSHHHLPGAWWTMPVELWCSLALLGTLIVWGALGRRGQVAALVTYCVGLAVLVLTTDELPPLYFQDLGGALRLLLLSSFAFVLGATLARQWARDPDLFGRVARRIPGGTAVIAGVGLTLGVFPRLLEPLTLGYDAGIQLGIMSAAALVVVAVLGSERVQGWLQAPVTAWLGRISFSVYLVHVAVQRTVMARGFTWLRTDLDLPYNLAAVIAIVGQLALVLLLADLLSRTVDRAAMTWGKGAVDARLGITRPSPPPQRA